MSIRIHAKKLAKHERRRCREKQRAKLEEARRKPSIPILPEWQSAFLTKHTMWFDPARPHSLITREDLVKLDSICSHAKERGEERGVLSLLQQHMRSDFDHVQTWCPGWVRVKQQHPPSPPAREFRFIYYFFWGRVIVNHTGWLVITVMPWNRKPRKTFLQGPRRKRYQLEDADETQEDVSGESRPLVSVSGSHRAAADCHKAARAKERAATVDKPSSLCRTAAAGKSEERIIPVASGTQDGSSVSHSKSRKMSRIPRTSPRRRLCTVHPNCVSHPPAALLPQSEAEWGMAIWGADRGNTLSQATVALTATATTEVAKEKLCAAPAGFVTKLESEEPLAVLVDEHIDIDAI